MIDKNIQYSALLMFLLCFFYISYMPSAMRKHREVYYKYYLNEAINSFIRNVMLLQELSQRSDFVKIDPPECVEIDYNGEHFFCSTFYMSHCFILVFRCYSKDLSKAISTSFKIYQRIWILGTK